MLLQLFALNLWLSLRRRCLLLSRLLTVLSCTACKLGHGWVLLHIIDGNPRTEGEIFTGCRVWNQTKRGHAFWACLRNARTRLDRSGDRVQIFLRAPRGTPIGGFPGIQRASRIWI